MPTTLTGSAAANTFRGGAGADILDGGAGFDTANYAGSTVGVTVNLATGTGSSGAAYGDTLASIEAVTGSAYADTLARQRHRQYPQRWRGDDILRGAGGKDLLAGGSGADRFVFAIAGDSAAGMANADRITDFSHAQADRIDLSQIDANGGAAGTAASPSSAPPPTPASPASCTMLATAATAVIGGDVDGDGVSDFNIVLSHVGSLQAADFVL